MTTYVFRNGELVDRDQAPPLAVANAAPNVITDEMPPTRHMVTGKYHTSKAAFRAETKAVGCVEVGNDSSLSAPRKPVILSREKRREDIARAIYELKNR